MVLWVKAEPPITSQSQFLIQLICCGLPPAYTPSRFPRAFQNKSKLRMEPMSPLQCLQPCHTSPSPQSCHAGLCHPQNMGRKDFSLTSMVPETQSTLPLFPCSPVTFSWRSSRTSWASSNHTMTPYLMPSLHRPRALHVEGTRETDLHGGWRHTVREEGPLPSCRKQLVWKAGHPGPDQVHGLGKLILLLKNTGYWAQ